VNIGWILCGPRDIPSARIEGYNLHKWLNCHDHNSKLLYTPSAFTHGLDEFPLLKGIDIIIFQKVFQGNTPYVVNICKESGIKVVYYITDWISGFDFICQSADLIIISSDFMKSSMKKEYQNKIVILKDAYETPKDLYKHDYSTDKVKVTWYGREYGYEVSQNLRPLMEDLGYGYKTISNHLKSDKQWGEETIAQDLINSDIVVLPYNIDLISNKCKDENKLVQAMVLGLPCIVSALPSYVELHEKYVSYYSEGIINSEPFFIANNLEGWKNSLVSLGPKETRKMVGESARECVKDAYNIDTIGTQLVSLLGGLYDNRKESKSEID